MVRATAIAMLRAKDGRKLGVKATEALRAVQEDLQDAWVELDQFIDNVGENTVVVEESVDVEEEQPAEEVIEEKFQQKNLLKKSRLNLQKTLKLNQSKLKITLNPLTKRILMQSG